MMFLKNANELAAAYKAATAETEKKRIAMEIFTALYFNIERLGFTFREEDARYDFLLQFYPKLHKILETYDSSKANFLTYLVQSLKFAHISFNYKAKTAATENKLLESEEMQQFALREQENDEAAFILYASEISIQYAEKTTASIDCKKLKGEEKIIFLLACKSCLFLTDRMIFDIAKRLKIPYTAFSNLIHNLKTACGNRGTNINRQIYKRNKYYMRMKLCKRILERCEKTSANYKKYEKACRYYFLSWKRAILLNKKQIKAPSNRLIEKYVNISRGTIDKNLAKALKLWYNQNDETVFSIEQ